MKDKPYAGYEPGSIRPPNETDSLMFRVSRNCPWNKCTFCPLYRGKKFSVRPVDQILEDINIVHKHVEALAKLTDRENKISPELFIKEKKKIDKSEYVALHLARNWVESGMNSIFIQDADSLVLKPADIIKILSHIKRRFPMAEKTTTYARSHTIARISDQDLIKMAGAGLNRIHIGLETGSDNVLKFVKKGCLKKDHIEAGEKVKNAGITLSVNVMPGLGGKKYSREHALESADAINQINPDFIRLRSFVPPDSTTPFTATSEHWFEVLTDMLIAKEILLLIESLEGISSTLESAHPLNLFEGVKGSLPRDKSKMTRDIEKFIEMDQEKQMIYQIGKRSGVFASIEDLNNSDKVSQIKQKSRQDGITLGNVDRIIFKMKQKFI